MKQYQAFDPNVKVNAQAVVGLIDAVSDQYKGKVQAIALRHGVNVKISSVQIPWQNELNIYQEVADLIGNLTLKRMGSSIAKAIKLPQEFPHLEAALKGLNDIYKATHTGGNIGYYRLTKFDEHEGEAEMVCFNPYPGYFDQGLILGFVNRYKPKDAMNASISPITETDCREQDGGAKSTYRIVWETFTIRQRRRQAAASK